ncbi:MAG: T9SS type A sorting domain-containing protein [Ginsengibacter sp.]
MAGFNLGSQAQVRSTFNPDAIKSVKFYPNPAISNINFEFAKDYNKSYSLVVYNFIGKKVAEFPASGSKITFSVSDLYRGVYIFQLRDPLNNVVESGKFQVVH